MMKKINQGILLWLVVFFLLLTNGLVIMGCWAVALYQLHKHRKFKRAIQDCILCTFLYENGRREDLLLPHQDNQVEVNR